MTMIRPYIFLSLLVIFVVAPGLLLGQIPTGTPPFGTFSGSPDTINDENLNINLVVPIVHKPGRGTEFTYDMSYDSSIWTPVGSSGHQNWQQATNWGWRQVTEAMSGYSNSSTGGYTGDCIVGGRNYGKIFQYSGWAYHGNKGARHPVSGTSIQAPIQCGGNAGFTSTTNDGSGHTVQVSGPLGLSTTVTTRAGNVIIPSLAGSSTYTDKNGNQISAGSSGTFTDTLGTTVLTVSGTSPNPVLFTYTPPSGTAVSVSMTFVTYSVQTNFGCTGVSEYGPISNALVDRITLADSSFYQFTYEATPGVSGKVTGRIASVKLPAGGTISYSYTGSHNGIECADGTTAGMHRTTPDSGSNYWAYDRSPGTGAAYTTTITDPQGNQTVIQFQGIYETQRKVYQGGASSGTLLATTNTCYNNAALPCTATTVTTPILNRTVNTQLGASGVQTQRVYTYSSRGLITEEDDYDYATGSPTVVLKKIVISYATLTNGIYDKPAAVTTYDGSGNIVAQITTNYDETSVVSPPNTPTPQHTAITGSRGNPTTVKTLVRTGVTLNKTYTYYDTGNIKTGTDVNGAAATYNYGSLSSTCGNSFPDSVTEPLSLSKSFAWNCTGGVQTSTTDENGKTSSVSYTTDLYLWRPNATTDAAGNQRTFYYQPNTTYPSYATVWSLNFNNGSSEASDYRYLDGLGRTYVDQHQQSPGASTLDTVSYTFDSNGRPYTTSLPCAVTWATTCPTVQTTTTYDALNRMAQVTDGGGGTLVNTYTQNDVYVSAGPAPTGENAKRRQNEYDALSRLTSVCEITSVSGSGTCGQTSPQTGFWTLYSYNPLGKLTGVTQNAQTSSTQTRTYLYDLVGRMTSETNPESGTTSYVYDTDSTCGTSNGDLVKRTDAMGNVTCYSYDALHRRLSITYPSGSYAPKTPNKYFVYDSATVNSVAMANGKTRMVEAYTATSQTGTKITDLGISYTVRGEPSDAYESTPHSGGYYHIPETYWANGLVNQIGNNIVGLPAFTFGPDGEGRVSSVSASAGQNPVTSVSYNSASLPTAVNLGSADSDTFTYDPNTNRMTQYKFSVNSQLLTGNLTWNANSTLHTQAITDALNSTDTQTCNYLYDDLTRIASANCGSVWSQTFSYDIFGNISKSGSASFAASYNPATNRISTVGGFTPTYDANGNTLTDPAHTYGWDSQGKPVSIDAVSLTYDALGRMVEQNRSGSYTEFVYSPGGTKWAIMSGQTLQKGMVPLPGGAVAVYGPNGAVLYYGHSDHLGSIRVGSTSSRSVSFDLAYAPFGEIYATSGSTDPTFTGQRQDTVSGDFDFPAREYSNEGRWTTPDPSGSSAFSLVDPQSLNLYAYVRNSPLSLTDPTGLRLEGWPRTMPAFFSGAEGGVNSMDNIFGCNIDGISQPCSLAGEGGEATVACPNNSCTQVDAFGAAQKFWAFAGGGSGFYAFAGPGALYYSPDQAGAAAVLFYGPITTQSDDAGLRQEFSGAVYLDPNGVYSYTEPTELGPQCSPTDEKCTVIPATWVPPGATQVGDWHTHPWDSPAGAQQFGFVARGPIMMGSTQLEPAVWVGDLASPNAYPGYVSTPIGNDYGVFRFLGGGSHTICNLSGPSLGIPSCH